MSNTGSSDQSGDFTQSLSDEIDAACDRFEAAWRSRSEPKIEAFLAQAPQASRGELFYQLLLVDLHWRRKRQESPTPDDYGRRFPDFCRQIEAAFANVLPSPACCTQQDGRGAGGEGNAASHTPDSNHTDPESTLGRRQGLHLRCPHCHNAVEVVLDESSDSIACPSCGQTFAPHAGATEVWTPAAETAAPQPRTLGHLQLLDKVGEGAFGAVWKAKDTKLDRIVAVKIPRRGQLEAEEVEKFLREARAAAQLKHPNIVGVHDVGQHGDTVFIVSDFIDGPTLAQSLKQHLPDERAAAELCRKIALALDYAHSKGVIHRDLKPGNVMIDVAGEPYIMDFGLAKRQGGEITMTVEGSILGTPAYMSPEQARGEGNKADARSDVYSLGVMLFEFLTGERPFRGETMMLLMQVIEDDPPPVRRLNSRISRDLETIVAKCLEKPPGKRYQTGAELAAELGRFLRGEPILARPIGWPARFWRWCKRQPVIAALTSAIALSLVVGILTSSYFAVSVNAQKKRADEKALQAAESLVKAVLTAPAETVPYAIENLMPVRELALPILERQYGGGQLPPSQRLHAVFAMAALGRVERDFLAESIASARPDECRNFIAALRLDKESAVQCLRHPAEKAGKNKDWPQKARLAIVALYLGESALARDMLQVEQRPDPIERTVFIKTFSTWHGNLSDLLSALESVDAPAIRSGICCAMASVSPDALSPADKSACELALRDWYRSRPDASTHSAAGFALGQWNLAVPAITPARQPETGARWCVNSIGMTLVLIPAGEFLMGSPASEDGNPSGNQHWVRITKPFWLGMHLVTVGQFRKFVEESKHDAGTDWQKAFAAQTDDYPVVWVDWGDAKAFCDWLTKKEGKRYRLPTEAEWEYACRAGTRTIWSFGGDQSDLGDHAWFMLNSKSQMHAVGQKRPNGWGLFDMHGNASQWCEDWYDDGYFANSPTDDPTKNAILRRLFRHRLSDADSPTDDPTGPATGSARVRRGGSWSDGAWDCRSANRDQQGPRVAGDSLGFRVILVPAEK